MSKLESFRQNNTN